MTLLAYSIAISLIMFGWFSIMAYTDPDPDSYRADVFWLYATLSCMVSSILSVTYAGIVVWDFL